MLLSRIIEGDDPYVSYDRLTARVKTIFPVSFAVTVASSSGELYVDDFDGIIEEVCRKDITLYGSTVIRPLVRFIPIRLHTILILGYRLNYPVQNTSFFVSFKPALFVTGVSEQSVIADFVTNPVKEDYLYQVVCARLASVHLSAVLLPVFQQK